MRGRHPFERHARDDAVGCGVDHVQIAAGIVGGDDVAAVGRGGDAFTAARQGQRGGEFLPLYIEDAEIVALV